jgi:hypothetical protein
VAVQGGTIVKETPGSAVVEGSSRSGRRVHENAPLGKGCVFGHIFGHRSVRVEETYYMKLGKKIKNNTKKTPLTNKGLKKDSKALGGLLCSKQKAKQMSFKTVPYSPSFRYVVSTDCKLDLKLKKCFLYLLSGFRMRKVSKIRKILSRFFSNVVFFYQVRQGGIWSRN